MWCFLANSKKETGTKRVTSTSLWRQYEDGARVVYGHELPDGLRKNTMLPEALVTPTTKAEHGGHDEPLT